MTKSKLLSYHFVTLAVTTVSTLLLLAACNSSTEFPPAPLDSTSGLESLASAFKLEATKLPTAANMMRPKARKQFVIGVFSRANFSYDKTLESFLQRKNKKNTKNIKDLAELLAMVHKGVNTLARQELYSEQELKAIVEIDRVLSR